LYVNLSKCYTIYILNGLITIVDSASEDTADGRWDQKALQRVYYPQKTESEVISKENDDDQEPVKSHKEPEHFTKKPIEQCFKNEYPLETADELRVTLSEEPLNIIVTVWFENYQGKWDQNMMNQNVQGTLWRCICENHPDIIYTEADLSHYNQYAYSYFALAKKLEIGVKTLYHGPTVAVMRDQTGMTFRAHDDSEKLLNAVEQYIRELELKFDGVENPLCDMRDQSLAENHYEVYMPYGELEMYDPNKHVVTKAKTVEPRKSYILKEPTKAMSF
jgi:hypothetical protein